MNKYICKRDFSKRFLNGDYCYVLDTSYSCVYADGIRRYVYIIQANDGKRYGFSEIDFNRYFIDIKRERMLKLLKINESSL